MGHGGAAVLTAAGDYSPPSMLRKAQMSLSEGIGVGFWNRADAEAQARAEERRTGRTHEVQGKPTPHETHVLWFVKRATHRASPTERPDLSTAPVRERLGNVGGPVVRSSPSDAPRHEGVL